MGIILTENAAKDFMDKIAKLLDHAIKCDSAERILQYSQALEAINRASHAVGR